MCVYHVGVNVCGCVHVCIPCGCECVWMCACVCTPCGCECGCDVNVCVHHVGVNVGVR